MKKNLMWMFAAILTSGLTLTSCSVEDNPNPNPAGDPIPTVVDFEDEAGVDAFVPNKLGYEIVKDETDENGTNVAKFTYAGKGYCFATYALDNLENATNVKVSYDFSFPASISGQAAIVIGDAFVENLATGGFNTGNPQYGFGSNGAIFYLGASRGKVNGANQNYFWVNGTPAASTVSEEGRTADDMWGKWFHVDLNVNVTAKTLDFVVTHNDEVWFEATDSAFISANAETCTQFGVFLGNQGSILIDNLSVTKSSADPSIKYADYTISYVDVDGNPIPEDLKTTITRRGKVGTAIELLDADKANFTNADGSVKYVYQSDNAEGATIAEGTEIKIVYKSEEVAKYQYIFNCMIEGQSGAGAVLSQVRGEEFEGRATTIYLPIAFYKDGKVYTTAPAQYNGKTASVNGTEAKTSGYILTTINYALDESLVYFGECEDLDKEGNFLDGFSFGTFDRVSQGKTIRPQAGATITTPVIAAGTFDVSIFCRSDKGEVHVDMLYVKLADGTLQKVEALPDFVEYNKMKLHESMATLWNAGMGWLTFKGVTIPEGASLVIKNETAEDGLAFDCIKVAKIAETPAE